MLIQNLEIPRHFMDARSLLSDEAPQYHAGILEVKFRQDIGPLAIVAGGVPMMLTRAMAAEHPGMGTLMSYERSGLIRRVTPLSDSAVKVAIGMGETPMLASFAAASHTSVADDPNARVSMIELYDDADIGRLESELRMDQTIESVSRVPVRYLLAKKKVAVVANGSSKKRTSKPSPAVAIPLAVPPSASSLWNLAKIRWMAARALPGFRDANTIKVAVLDTGVDRGHPDLQGVIAGYEYQHQNNPTASTDRDIIGHGTHVTGTIAANINNAVGINGICTCQIYMQKIFDDIPDWYPQQGAFAYFVEPVMYARALSRCLSLGVNVINLSIGGPGAPSPQELQLFNLLLQRGTTIVAAMGNEASSRPSYPAAIDGVVAVGATSINDVRASFSNFGPHVGLVAPGVSIWSTLPTYPGNTGYRAKPTMPPTPDFSSPFLRDTDYAAWDGTSMASPHVAAAAALLLANKGTMSPAQVKLKLQESAVKVPSMNGQPFTDQFGAGRLDLANLLR